MGKKEIVPSKKSRITRDSFPSSRKVYVKGTIHKDVNVSMREIELSESKPMFKGGAFVKDKNQPVTVYDSSGPYTDPNIYIDIKVGIPKLRENWIFDRNDVEQLDEISSEYGKGRLYNSELNHLRFGHLKKPLAAKKGKNVQNLRTSYALKK